MSQSDPEMLSDAYRTAEARFLAAVRATADRRVIASEARHTASPTAAFNAEVHRKYHARAADAWMAMDQLTGRIEVLTELCNDIASAYEA